MLNLDNPIARYVRVVTGKEVLVIPEADNDFVSGDVMWLRHVPEDVEGLARISWREEHPAFMGRLMHLISHMKIEHDDEEDKSWNDLEIEAIQQLLKDKPLLNHALKNWLMEQMEDADDSAKKGLVRIGESTGLVYKEEAESLLEDIDKDVEESDIEPCTDYSATSPMSLGLEFPFDLLGGSQNPDMRDDSEGNDDRSTSEQAEDSPDNLDNAKSSEQENQYFSESEPNPFTDITEAGSSQEEEAKRYFEEKNYEIVKEERQAIRKARREADKTFPKASLDVRTRKPVVEDRKLRTKLTKELRNAKWRAPTRSEVQASMPPGRLSSRDAVLWTAQESMELPITAKPFIQERVQTREAPPPYLGMACDVSGSMGDSEKPMSSLIWAMSNAVPSVGGKFAAVSFDRQVKSLAKPGKRLSDVPLIKARGDYEAAYQAIQSLVGGLDLLNPQKGVRVLLISSDAMWRKREIDKSQRLLKSLERSGVHILWVTFQVGLAKMKTSDAIFADIGTVIEFEDMDDIALGLGRAISQIVERV